MQKLQFSLFLFLVIQFHSNAQTGQSLDEIMEEKFPSNIANSSQYAYSFLATNNQRQLIQLKKDYSDDTYLCITDGTKTNSTFYGQVNNRFGYFPEGEEFSFLRPNPNDIGILELLKYDDTEDTLLVSNSFDFDLNQWVDFVVILEPNLFGIFDRDGFDYFLRIIEPSDDTFVELQNILIPSKLDNFHHFISPEEYLYLNDNSNGELVLSKFNYNTSSTSELGVISTEQMVVGTQVKDQKSNDRYTTLLVNISEGGSEINRPVVYDKQEETLTILDNVGSYGIGNNPGLALFLTDNKLFVYKPNGEIDYYNLVTNEKKVIPFPTRGAIEYTLEPREYLVKGDSIFVARNAQGLGWSEYFYYDEPNNQFQILVDDYYESNGFASRGGGMLVSEDEIILGFQSGFDSCGIMFLEEDLGSHFLYNFPNDDFCVGDLWSNDQKLFLRNFRQVRIMDKDNDADNFFFWDDCDDSDAGINPDAADIANNGIDENCDGEDLTTGTKEVSKLSAKLYPNPTNGFVHLELDKSYQDLSIAMYNVIGNKIHEEIISTQDAVIDISKFSEGIYFFTIRVNNEKVITKRLVVSSKR